MNTDTDYLSQKAQQYIDEGFCVLENMLPPDFLSYIQTACFDYLATVDDVHREAQRSTGSMINACEIPELAELVTFGPVLEVYRQMGFDDVRFSEGYLISKPPRSPQLFWHFDWMGWSHPRSYEKTPLQAFFMYYLVDTRRENGCLRVIPRSHIDEHPLHQILADAHSPDLRQAKELDRPEFSSYPDEVEVHVKAGDLVIGDSRLIHGSHPNDSDEERPVITLWMHPNFGQLPPPLQAFSAVRGTYSEWPEEAQTLMASMRPTNPENAEPTPRSRTRFKPNGDSP